MTTDEALVWPELPPDHVWKGNCRQIHIKNTKWSRGNNSDDEVVIYNEMGVIKVWRMAPYARWEDYPTPEDPEQIPHVMAMLAWMGEAEYEK